MAAQGSSDLQRAVEGVGQLTQAIQCPLCNGPFKNPHSFTSCKCTFCYDCVYDKLVGPGIVDCKCPKCQQPGFLNDLRFNHTLANVVEAALGVEAEVQRLPRKPLQPRSAAAPAAAATGDDTGAGASTKRRRRGRSVPEPEAAAGVPPEEPEQQAAALPPLQQQKPAGDDAGEWHLAQPQHQWRRNPKSALKAAGAQGQPPAAAAVQQQQQQPAAQHAQPAQAPAELEEGSVPDSPSTQEELIEYDSDWEAQELAKPPPGPEEVAALEIEVELLKQALLLCETMPCRGGRPPPPLPPQAHRGKAAGGQAASAAPPAAAAGGSSDGGGPDDGMMIVPDTQEGPSPPRVLQPALPPASTAAAGAAAPTTGEEAAAQQQDAQQERTRQLAEFVAGQAAHAAQQRTRHLGLTQEVEEGVRMSGRKRRKGASGRGTASGRQGRPTTSAAATTAAAAASEPAAAEPAAQQQQQQQPPLPEEQQAQPAQQAATPAPCVGDAVVVTWNIQNVLQPCVGKVVAIEDGKCRIVYLDGDDQWHAADMQGEEWRRISPAEYAAAEAAASQRSGGSACSGSSGPSGNGSPASWSVSESGSQGDDGDEVGAATAHQQAQESPAAAAPRPPAPQAPSPSRVAAAAAQPAPAQPADPYQFVSNTEAGGFDAALPQRPGGKQEQQQRRLPLALGRRPLVPPPKFHQSPPARQQPPPQQLPQQQQQQQFARKRKGPSGSDETTQAPAQAPDAAAAEEQGWLGAGGASGFVPCSQAPQDPMGAEPAVGSEPLGTQGAADALFGLLQQRQLAAAQAAGGDFVSASQLLADASPSPSPPPQRRRQQPQQAAGVAATAAPQRPSGKALQDPGLFPLPAGAGASSGHRSSRNEGLHAPPIYSPGSQAQPQAAHLRSAGDLFAGISPVAVAPPAVASGSRGGAPRRCIVISANAASIQERVNELQALLGSEVEVQPDFKSYTTQGVRSPTTHVLMPVDDCGCIKMASMQYMLGLAHGCWLVGYSWAEACLEAGQWVPERHFVCKAQSSLGPDYALVPAEARRRHADGAPGLFAACRVLLLVPPPARGGHAPSARNLRLQVEQMVRAEGGAVAHSLAEGRSSPSPSPEGAATLLVCVGQGRDEMQAGLKLAKKRYPGRALHHVSWVFHSVQRGRLQDPGAYLVTDAQPVPAAVLAQLQASGRASLSQATLSQV